MLSTGVNITGTINSSSR